MSKRVLVTGGSRGIGKAISLQLGKEGWSVAIHYGTQKVHADATGAELGSNFSGAFKADLADPENVGKLWNEVIASGPLDAIVNNAGIYMPVDFADSGDAAFAANLARTFNVNFQSPVRLMRLATAHFLSEKRPNGKGGKILNVASRVGFRGEPGAAPYAASKAALINFSRSLAVELAPKRIGVFGIAPGWVDTAMTREGMADRLPEILETIPVGRMASPEDCAVTAAFLLSEKAAYLSGVFIDINGASYFH